MSTPKNIALNAPSFANGIDRPAPTDAELIEMLEASRNPSQWYVKMREVVGHLNNRGMDENAIRYFCVDYCDGAFDDGLTEIIDKIMKKPVGVSKTKQQKAKAEPKPDSPFLTNKKGEALPVLANVLRVLRSNSDWQIARDLFAGRDMLLAPVPDATGKTPNQFTPRPLEDGDIIRATEWFQSNGFSSMSETAVTSGLTLFAVDNSFDPLVDTLRGLQWDGVERLENWLIAYCGALADSNQPVEYVQAAGKRWMTSAVARALKPGCKADTALVLVGNQGIGKSTAAKVLAYHDEWFSDSLPPVGTKEASDHLRGKWIVEFGEMATLGRADLEEFKAFMTRTTEKFRPVYGRKEIEYPRRCVFIGSSNENEFLKDVSGNRRFLPITVAKIDIDLLKRDRDMLWAEAVHLFDQGEQWHLTAEEAAVAAGQQESFMIVDERTDRLREFLIGKSQVKILDALTHLEMKHERKEQLELGRMLRALKWKKQNTRTGKVWVPERHSDDLF